MENKGEVANSKWRMFKQFMHNELGISKEDIKGWVMDAVEGVVNKKVDAYLLEHSIEGELQKAIIKVTTGSANPHRFEFHKDIRSEVAGKLYDNLVKSLRIKE